MNEPKKSSKDSTHSSPRSSGGRNEEDINRVWDYLPKKFRVKKRGAYIRRHSDLKVSSTYRIFALLMWKITLVTKRRWKTSSLQLSLPILCVTLLVIYVYSTRAPGYTDRIYKPFKIDTDVKHIFSECDTIYFLPKNPIMERIKDHLEEAFKKNNEKLRFTFLKGQTSEPTPTDLCALIEFHKGMWKNMSEDTLPSTITYDIRFPAVHSNNSRSLTSIGTKWNTGFRYPAHLIDGAREVDDNTGGEPYYYKNGFLYIQNLIASELMEIIFMEETLKLNDPRYDASILNAKFNELQDKVAILLSRFPFPAHESDDSVLALYKHVPTTLVAGFGASSVIMVYLSVKEREMGIRKLLKMYGIENSFHKYTWILFNLLYQLFTALSITLILSVNWRNTLDDIAIIEDNSVTEHFLILLICYIYHTLCTVTLLLCFFSRASTACIAVSFIWTVSYIPYLYIETIYNILNFWQKALCCLSCNTAIGIGCHLIAVSQASGIHMSLENVFGNAFQEFTIGWVYVIMIVAGTLKVMIANYVSKVFSDEGIQKLPWNYLFKLWYWNNELPPDEVVTDRTQEKSFEETHPEYFENDSHIKRRKELTIENLSKYFGQLRAVHKMNLICFQGYVTVLLGDEGSGKSSLLQMLNGTLVPSYGTIQLNRKDMYKNPVLSRAFVGYCPNEDLLFPDLTVDETLQFFTELKGVSNRIEAYEEVERFLKITMLADFRDTRVCELTKSSQRILMAATAFCGGSRVVLLDDPTLNLSAAQRRVLWDFTGQEKKHRTVIVGMDLVHEVDNVVDKIVLLHYGQITTRGSPEFLQNKFGGGYHLEIETKDFCEKQDIQDLIDRRIKGSQLFHSEPNFLNFYLPPNETVSFPGVLEELENSADVYKISGFRVKFITLEELHLSLKRKSSALEGPHDSRTNKRKSLKKKKSRRTLGEVQEVKINIPSTHLEDDRSDKLFSPHNLHELKLMFLKNMKYTFRFRVLFWGSTIGTLILLILGHFMVLSLNLTQDNLPHHLTFLGYEQPHILTDILRSTNEGVYMRSSVNKLLENVTTKHVPYKGSIVSEVLKEYNLHENELEVPLLGLQIAPFRESLEDGKEKVLVGITGYFNNQPLHTPGVILALVNNILIDHLEDYIQRKISRKYVPKGYSFNVSNHPLDYQPADLVKHSEILFGPGYVFGVLTSFGYSFFISSYIILHIKEQDFRHLQFTFGANKLIFWAANYLWNFLHFSLVALLHALAIAVIGIPGFPNREWKNLGVVGVLFFFTEIYGCTSAFFVGSCASFWFKSWGRGFSKISLFYIATGPLAMIALIPLHNGITTLTIVFYTFLHNILLFFPNYAFGTGIYFIVTNEVHKAECKRYDKYATISCEKAYPDFSINPFTEFATEGSTLQTCCFNKRESAFSMVAYGVGRNVLMMLITMALCAGQKVFHHSKRMRELEKKWLDKRSKKWRPVHLNERDVKDYDVLAEAAKIYHGQDHHELTIKDLTLETPLYTKIDSVCLEVQRGECFALLGAPGAGKSTFLRLLSGYPGVMPTYGDVELKGQSLMKDFDKYIQNFSYCPDTNPFLDELTALEILDLMGTLRRIPKQLLDQYITHYSINLGMTSELDGSVKTHSFVMVKKLCSTVALMGNFQVLLMDDPTHHLDPKSRDFIVSEVKRLMADGCIVIWSCHNIELCESVCTKMSILVNGHMKCIGSLQHLKDLYEEGYTVIVRFILDRDMIYFTSKKNLQLENEIRQDEIDEDTGLPVGTVKEEQRTKKLIEVLHEDAEEALQQLAPWELDLCPFIAFFEKNFPDAILVDKQPGFVHYHVHEGNATWSSLFSIMEEAKALADVDYYYVCRSNLDQVYFNYTRGQVTFDTT